jgi:hypothetical protein
MAYQAYIMQCTKYCGDLSWQIIAQVLSGLLTEDNMYMKRYLRIFIKQKSYIVVYSLVLDNKYSGHHCPR